MRRRGVSLARYDDDALAMERRRDDGRRRGEERMKAIFDRFWRPRRKIARTVSDDDDDDAKYRAQHYWELALCSIRV